MAHRGIYFVFDNQLFVNTVEIPWDKESMTVNKIMVSEELFKSAEHFMQPCVDISGSSPIWRTKQLSIFNVVDEQGNNMKDLWNLLDSSKDTNFLPPGSHELIYLKSLNEQQLAFALSIRSFYDIYYNSEKKRASPAVALCALQLLYNQYKLDYINDMDKFLHWFWVNCRCPVEWHEHYYHD